jgi:C terminal of Calcineurin-like phosphoesterase/N terminal of Calcineurin-like phosphoesterase/Calcineurin-like phosphoesterase
MLRRSFIRATGSLTAALTVPETLLADPYGEAGFDSAAKAFARVRGRIRAAGRGVAGVGVTDGVTTVATDRDGRYTLLASPGAQFVSIRLPAGYRIPTQETGIARLHQPILPDRRGEAEASFTLERLPSVETSHAFLLFADTQTENAFEVGRLHAETVPDVQETLASFGDRHVFGVACGDIMFDDLTLYPEYERAVTSMGIPCFQVVGNHDLDFAGRTDEASVATFESRFGRGYYSFDRGDIHYVVLDDVLWFGSDYLGYLDGRQLTWLAGDLARVESGRTVVVFLHIPVASSRPERLGSDKLMPAERLQNREALYRLLEPYRVHVLSGHTHEHEHLLSGTLHEHVHGAVCGAWWSGNICWDGTPNGYGVWEATGEDLRWRYKATGQPADQRMRIYPRGADPTAPTDIVANIWDWDPACTVVWYEGGDRRGELSRRVGLDPLSVRLHTGPTLPRRRPWVEPTPTGHLFYVAVPEDTGTLTVEVTDRWGARFTASLEPVPVTPPDTLEPITTG